MADASLSSLKAAGLKTVAILALIAPLPACVFNNPLDRQLTSAVVLEPSPLDGYQYELAEDVPLSRAFVELPMLTGPVIAVREKRYANGIEQVIILESEAAADGENRIEVRVTQPGKSDSRIKDEYLQVRSSRQEQIRSDMKEFVWGIPMQIVSSVEANAYGTYGYALGRSKIGYNCLLGWQNVKGVMKERRLLGFTTTSHTDMSLRLRICRTDLNADQLVSIIRGMRITVDPAALMQEPKMIWRNEGYNISGSQEGNGTAPGYVTEGVALPDGSASMPEMTSIDLQPEASEPVTQPVVKARPPVARQTAPQTKEQTKPQDMPPATAPKKRPEPGTEEFMVDQADPETLDGADPQDGATTIFVDPREYATVPTPGTQGVIAKQPAAKSKPSVFSPLGSNAGPLKPTGSAAAQSQEAREQRKSQVREIPLGEQSLSNSGFGQRNTGNDKQWLNDVARDSRDGAPLKRPCELLRNQKCTDEN